MFDATQMAASAGRTPRRAVRIRAVPKRAVLKQAVRKQAAAQRSVRSNVAGRPSAAFEPFRELPVTTRFARVLDKVLEDIATLDDAFVHTESPATLKRRFVERARLVPLALDVAACRIVGEPAAAVVDVIVPFVGDPLLWATRPTGCLAPACPEIEVRGGFVRFRCAADTAGSTTAGSTTAGSTTAGSTTAGLGAGVEHALGALLTGVARMARDVKRHNADAFKAVCKALQMKRARARAALHGGTTAAATLLPATPRRPPVGMLPPPSGWRTHLAAPRRSAGNQRLGSEIPDGEFERILRIVDGCVAALGRSPTAARSLDADLVRTFLLIQLNAHYEGAEGGEAFTASSDGDILLEADGRVAFVARVCLWGEADAAHGADTVERAVAGMLAHRGSKPSRGVLLLLHADRLQREARHALHDAVAPLRGGGQRRVSGGGGVARCVLAAPDAAGGTIVVHGITCGLRRE